MLYEHPFSYNLDFNQYSVQYSRKMFVSNVILLLVLTIFDGQIRGAPVEHRLEDVLIFDRDPDQPPNTVELADPTKPIKVPSISEDDAEVKMQEFLGRQLFINYQSFR